jgi:2-oxoglutarate ferredoxin oxidoreductase subunit beta
MSKPLIKLDTSEKNTWCPGCLNFTTLAVLKKSLRKLDEEGKISLKKTVLVTDIGCGAKIYDYINVSAVYALHGRVLPVASA